MNFVAAADDAAGDAAGAAGVITLVDATIGGLTTTVNTSSTKPAIPQPELDISFTAVGVGDVWLYATDTDYDVIAGLAGSLDGNFSGAASVQACLYGGVDNTFGTLDAEVCSAIANSSPFHETLTKAAASTSPYSMSAAVHLVRTTAGITTGDFAVVPVPVPEPGTVLLLGSGLMGFAFYGRRGRRESPARETPLTR